MSTYSFINITASLTGPGATGIDLGYGAAVAKEGITVARAADKAGMAIGADGEGMHSLHADKSGTVSIRLLKTSPMNQVLQNLYNFQTSSAANFGQNTIVVKDIARGDTHTCQQCGFKKLPDVVYAEEGTMHDWSFNVIKIDSVLGALI